MKETDVNHAETPDNYPLNRTGAMHMLLCGALMTPTATLAQDHPHAGELAPIQVTGNAPEFKVDHVQSVKFQAPLVDTPQTINIVPAEVLQQQGAQSLQDVLRNVPGITFSSGEGGAGWGD